MSARLINSHHKTHKATGQPRIFPQHTRSIFISLWHRQETKVRCILGVHGSFEGWPPSPSQTCHSYQEYNLSLTVHLTFPARARPSGNTKGEKKHLVLSRKEQQARANRMAALMVFLSVTLFSTYFYFYAPHIMVRALLNLLCVTFQRITWRNNMKQRDSENKWDKKFGQENIQTNC